jgi:hypothetical protein
MEIFKKTKTSKKPSKTHKNPKKGLFLGVTFFSPKNILTPQKQGNL